MDQLADLLDPIPLPTFTSVICEWLQDAHDEAAELQRVRAGGSRGSWRNNTSFGTDRYQFLLNTAESLTAALPGLQVDSAFQVTALKLPKVGIYQMQVTGGPGGTVADPSDLRRELLNSKDHQALLSRPEALFGDRRRLILVWTGTEAHGLTGVWLGQGELVDNHIDWFWRETLLDATGAAGVPRQTGPLDPTIFDLPQPELPMRPRDTGEDRRSG